MKLAIHVRVSAAVDGLLECAENVAVGIAVRAALDGAWQKGVSVECRYGIHPFCAAAEGKLKAVAGRVYARKTGIFADNGMQEDVLLSEFALDI